MKKALITFVAAAAALAVNAATLEFTYNPDPESTAYKGYGFSKKETYDVAIRIADPTLTGARITGLSVPMPADAAWLTDVTGWVTSELRLDGKVNAPDITSCAGEVKDRRLTVTFAEPYTMTADGVYVGYSFKVTELGDYSTTPVACVEGSAEGGFWLHTSRTRMKWTDEGTATGFVSAMTVYFESESGPTDAALSLPPISYILAGEAGEVPVDVVNYGTETLNSLGYTWKAGADGGSGTLSLTGALVPGGRATVMIPIGPCATAGSRTLEVTADTFNGQPNSDPRRTASGPLAVMPFMPVNRPVVEEFTGLLCPNCPRGYVSMEQMNDRYPDRFVGMAYHTQNYEEGCMVVMPDTDFPVGVSGYPEGWLNRSVKLDMVPEEVNEQWSNAAKTIAPARIDVTLEWVDEAHTKLEAKAEASFAREYENADMRLSIALIANGLKNGEWGQHNNYAGSSETGDYWDLFTQGRRVVRGLTFNDVVVSYTDTKGIEGSVPAVITLDTKPTVTSSFALDEIRNLKGELFLTPGCTLHAVGLLTDTATGAVLNAGTSQSLAPVISSVGTVGTAEVISTEWYSLQGTRIGKPAPGTAAIRIDRLADGRSVTLKTVAR